MGRLAKAAVPQAGSQPGGSTEPSAWDVLHAIEFDILFGRLRPRERLVEDQLIQRFGAKRHVVRQALIDLERIGIVVRTPNRGATVRDFTMVEVEEITEVRETLHRRAVQRMTLPADPELLRTLRSIQRRHDVAVSARDPRAIDHANEAFHAALFGACGNKVLADAIAHYAYLSRAMRLYPLVDPTVLATLRREHWDMIEAIAADDRRALTTLVTGHIQHSKKLYLQARGSPVA
jgi:DNA-binding GntR family transcriptional regulator